MQRLMCSALFVVLLAPLANAADVTGKWSGSLEAKDPNGETVVIPAHAELKQQGDTVTGRVWKEIEHQFSIEKGKIEQNRITFEFRAPEGSEGSEPVVHSVRVSVVSENQLQGEIEFAMEGDKMTAKLTFTREK
jgi:exosome complex RNA-binding protein Csl4